MILKVIIAFVSSSSALLAGVTDSRAEESVQDPLFASTQTVHVTITAPFEQIMRERPEQDYVPGIAEFIAIDGTPRKLDIGIRTRGEFRRREDICPFAPLRINFKKSQLTDTILDDQDKLKLVTHCRSGSARYDQTVVSEYLAYRILNLMTDKSFQVRLLHVTYVYSDRDNETEEGFAFFIEHKKQLAERLQLAPIELPKISIRDIDPNHTNLTSVFQFLIGNTDFSPVSVGPGKTCCHNYALFGTQDEPPYWPIPFDFDQSGFVNAPHAAANPRFELRSVRQRLYRGRCINRLILPDTVALYRAKRNEIEALINDQAELTSSKRKSILRYVEEFYKIIDNDTRVDSRMAKACI